MVGFSYKKRLWDFLGSRDLSVFLFVMGCTYVLILAIFSSVVPTPWVNRISSMLSFKVFYLMFFINLVICEIKWIPVVVRHCRIPKMPETEEDLQRFRYKIAVKGEFPEGVKRLEQYLKQQAYKVKIGVVSEISGESATLLHAYRGRFSPLGNLIFHSAFLFLLLGALITNFNFFSGTVSLIEGQEFYGSMGEYVGTLSGSAKLPEVSFKVNKIVPEFWEKQFLFTELRAEIEYQRDGEVETSVARLSQPFRLNGASITISDVGYVPMYVLRDREGNELDSGFVRLSIFPPGRTDHFQIPGFPHQIFVSFYPDHEIKEGRIVNRSMKPVNPAYSIRVYRNKVPSYIGIIRPGESAYFEGLYLSFPEFKYGSMFRIVNNPGHVYIWTGFVMLISGLVWRLLFERREIVLASKGETIHLYGNCDYYHRLFENNLRKLAGKVGI